MHVDMDEGAHGGQNRELSPLKLDFFLKQFLCGAFAVVLNQAYRKSPVTV